MTRDSSSKASRPVSLADRIHGRVEGEQGCPRCNRYNLIDMYAAAERLGVTRRHVRGLVDQRRIPFVKVGRFVRFNPRALDLWIEENTVEQMQWP